MRPKHLAIQLSKLQPHPCLHVELEQYATEGDLAAYWTLAIDQIDGISNRVVADLGSGNGVLGIGCLLMGASHVIFVESDASAVGVIQTNLSSHPEFHGRWTVHQAHVGRDPIPLEDASLIVMNPPWGAQVPKADRPFFDLALESQVDVIHVLHHERAGHLSGLIRDAGWESEHLLRTEFRLPAQYAHHAKRKAFTDVLCWRIHRSGDARLPQDDDDESNKGG
ncbi:MAG: methyltransferase [Candidatus Poseidonia sp.]|nr:methyltransferase [Poseidonia sp.]